jgi:DNA repair protein RecN (Recombination protein N)
VLVELRVVNLGVIEDQTILLGPGLTAVTGETGAGKTLLVDAISLLTGGSADSNLVAPGATEARIEGRFEVDPSSANGGGSEGSANGGGPEGSANGGGPEASGAGRSSGEDLDGSEVILTRVLPASGRSRCYINGRMVAAAELAGLGRSLVDIHGQHAHQSLLSPAAQRRALDAAFGIDTSAVDARRRVIRELTQDQAELGGDPRERARQTDLLSYQLREIEAAAVDDPDEDEALVREEELLGDAAGLVDAAASVYEALAGDDGAGDRVGRAVAAAANRGPLEDLHRRLIDLQEELSDVAASARNLAESVEDDPARLAAVGERRRILTELRRKYGGTLSEVMAYRDELVARLAEISSHEQRAADIEAALDRAYRQLRAAQEDVWSARQAAGPKLAQAVEAELHELAMPKARFEVEIGPDPADESVTWLLGANPGLPVLPLAKAASGGELARTMLATRLVTGPRVEGGPATLIFDEVDAGVGGEAAIAVGRALAALGGDHQVLVVTHLPQVAAFASAHLTISKDVVGGPEGERTTATARPVDGPNRVVEIARMLSGRPDSDSARVHAEELLAAGAAGKAGTPAGPVASPKSRARRR